MIGAIILAAGASRRMGRPKALVKIGERTFLQQIAETLSHAAIQDVVIVLGQGADLIADSLSWFDGKVVLNKDWERGQLSSIIAGIDAVEKENPEAVLIHPVDHPLVSTALIDELVQEWRRSEKGIILPSYKGRRGHPVIFGAALFDEIRNSPAELGARYVVRNRADDIAEVITEDGGVVQNIDTPDDLARIFGLYT